MQIMTSKELLCMLFMTSLSLPWLQDRVAGFTCVCADGFEGEFCHINMYVHACILATYIHDRVFLQLMSYTTFITH